MAEERKNQAAQEAVEAVAENSASDAVNGEENAIASSAVENEEVMTASIEDRLKEAAENIKRVNADAKARKLEQERNLKKSEEDAKARAEEAEKKRLEEETLVKTIAEQKLAAFAYAENYRKKLQRERSRAVEEERLREKAEREERLREMRTREIADHLESEKQEAQKRSERAAELLSRVTKIAKVGSDGRLSVVSAPEAPKPEAPKPEAVSSLSAEERAAREVEAYLGHGCAVYEEGDRLVLNIVDEQMTIQVGEDEPQGSGYGDAIREELELLRQQRQELSALYDEHRRFLNGVPQTENEVTEEPEAVEEQPAPAPAPEEPLDPVIIDDTSVLAVKYEGEKVDDKKSLIKYLKYSERVLKSFNKEIKQAEHSFTSNEDENESPALIAQILMTTAKVLEILCDNLAVCARMSADKFVKKYTRRLSDAIDDYNEYVIAYYDLTGQQLTRVSAFLPKYIASGENQAVIPALSYKETYVEIYVESDGSVSYGDDNITTTLITPAYSKTELLADSEVESARAARAYTKKTRKALKKLSAELDKLNAKIKSNTREHEKALANEKHAKTKLKEAIAALDAKFGGYREGVKYNKELLAVKRKYGKDVIKAEAKIEKATIERKNLKLLVETFAIEREKLDCLCTLLAKIRLVGSDRAVDKVKKDFVREMLEYNRLAEAVSAAIDAPTAKISASLADEVMRTGSEVLFPKMAYRRELIETVGEETRIVGDRLKTSFVGDIGGDDVSDDESAADEINLGKSYEAEQFAVDIAREESKTVSGSKSLKRFLKSTDRSSKSFRATLRQTEKSIMKAMDEGNVIASLMENIRIRGRFIELLAIRLVTVSKFVRGKKLRRETESLYNEIGKYNLKAIDYYNITGEQITRISAFLPENLASGAAEIVLPSISYKEHYVEVYSKNNNSDIISFEDVLEKRKVGAYSPVHAKNRRLTENKAVTVNPINPPYSAEELNDEDDPKNRRGRIKNARAARKSRRKLRRGLKAAKKNLIRVEKQNKRFDNKLSTLNRKHDKNMFAIESQTSAQERQSPKYYNKLQKVNRKFTSEVSKLELQRAKANIEQRRLKFIVERFVIEREFFAVACVKLAKLRNYGNRSIIAEAKNNLIKAMSDYNKCADACSTVLGEPIVRISASVADEIIRGASNEIRLPKIVCFKEIVETVGDKTRVVGEKNKYGMYGRNASVAPVVGLDAYRAPAMGIDIDGTPIIGAVNPVEPYVMPAVGAAAPIVNPAVNGVPAGVVNPMFNAAPANGFVYEAPIGTAPISNAQAAQATYTVPMMPPVYGFVPPVVTEERTSKKGDAYEETVVNDDIADLTKYTFKAMRAKSLIVETPREYRSYKRRSKAVAHEIEAILKRTDSLHSFTDKTVSKLRDITTTSEKKAYRKITKKLKHLAIKSKDQLIVSKVHSIFAELDSMKKNSTAAEMVSYASNTIESDICAKFDLDIISALGKLVEIRCQDLHAASKVNVRRYIRKTRSILSSEITNYNEHITDYNGAAAKDPADRLTHISTLVPDKIARKETGIFIPELLFNKKFVEEKLAVSGVNESAYTICIPTPEQLAAGATVSTVPNPRLGETENDNTAVEVVCAKVGYTADELLKGRDEYSPKKCMKEAVKAQNAIDRMLKKLDADIQKQKTAGRKRRRKLYKATAKYERAVLGLSAKSSSQAKYQRKLRIKSKRYGKRIIKIDRKYPAPELLDSKRLVLECFSLEQERLIISAIALKAAAGARSNRLLMEAKRRFINSVTRYNIEADRVSNELSASITHADEGWIDMVILDGKLPVIPRMLYKKDLVEVIGEKRRVIGERPVQFGGMYTIVIGANGAPAFAGGAFGAPAFGAAAFGMGAAAVSVAGSNTPPVVEEEAPVGRMKKNKKGKKAENASAAALAPAMAAPMMAIPLQVAYPNGMNAPQMVVMPAYGANGVPVFGNYQQLAQAYNAPEAAQDISVPQVADKKELKKLAAATKKSVTASDKALEKSVKAFKNTKKDADKPAKVVACLSSSRQIIGDLAGIMTAAVSLGETKIANSYSPSLRHEIGRYNSLSAEYTKLTGRELNLISQSLPDDILAGRPYRAIPTVEYTPAASVYRALNPETPAEAELRRVTRERAVNGVLCDANLEAKVAEQANKDLAVITKYMDFEISMLESARDIENFRYGKEDRVIRGSKKQLGKMIAGLKKTHLEALECERRDNERYYTVVMTDTDTLKAKKKRVNRAKLDSIRTRLIVLLNKRDEINSKLSAIYTGTERNLDGSSVNQKWRHVKNSAAEAMMRKDRKLAKKVAKVSASKGEKQRMYTLLNKRLDAASTMALSKYRLKHERNTYRTRRMLKQDIRECKTQIKLCSRDIKWMIQRFKDRQRDSGAGSVAGLIVVLLLVIGLVAGFLWVMRQDISMLISALFGSN